MALFLRTPPRYSNLWVVDYALVKTDLSRGVYFLRDQVFPPTMLIGIQSQKA